MAVDPRQAILQMMMQQGGGGMPPGGGGMPPGMPMPQGMPPQGMPPGADMGAGLPPQIMALAAQGIRPGDVGMGMPPTPDAYPRVGSTDADSESAVSESREAMTPSDEEPLPPEMMPPEPREPAPDMQGKYDPRFGPIKDRSREETEGEIDAVRNSMSERSIQAIEDDIREAAETGDTSAIEVLLEEMEEQGYEVAELPPDVQKMINIQDEENVRETEEPEED
jgi:hypothetical protein